MNQGRCFTVSQLTHQKTKKLHWIDSVSCRVGGTNDIILFIAWSNLFSDLVGFHILYVYVGFLKIF